MENQKVKLMFSYGGKIQIRPHDNQLCYVGGDTKILTLDRNVKFSEVAAKLNSFCNCNTEISIKYQLPGEDLDALVSLIDDDDVEQMMVEYDRMQKVSTKPARLRLFLFYPIRLPESTLNPDFLFGFDKDYNPNPNPTPTDDLLQLQFPGISAVPENSGLMDHKEGSGAVTVAVPKIICGGDISNSGSSSRLLVKNQNHYTQQGLRERQVNGGTFCNAVQMVYGLPVMTGGYHTGFGQLGVMATGGGQYMDQPGIYNFVPATPVMVQDQQHKMIVSTTDTLSREIKG